MSKELLARMDARIRATEGPPDLELEGTQGQRVWRALRAAMGGGTSHEVEGFRCRGRVFDDGRGWSRKEHPYGGSVIEGYDISEWLVIDGAVACSGGPRGGEEGPTTVSVWWVGDVARRAELEQLAARAMEGSP